MNLKIREAQLQKVPYMLVVGDREAQNGTVSVRHRKHGDQGVKPFDEFLAEINKLIEAKAPSSRDVLRGLAAARAGSRIARLLRPGRRRRPALSCSGSRHVACAATPAISVLKPLHGVDEGLEENLRTFFTQDYPNYEILFAVRDEADPAVAVVEKLQQRVSRQSRPAPDRRRAAVSNAKVCSLERMTAEARHDLLVMSDSDIRVTPDMLASIAAEFADPRVGVTTCPYRAVPGRSFWSTLEAIGMNTEFLGGVLVARMLEGMKFALGPTSERAQAGDRADRRLRSSERLSGRGFRDGQFRRRERLEGAAVVVRDRAPHRQRVVRGECAHRLRWYRSTRRSRPAGYVGQLFTNPLPLALLAVACWPALWPVLPITAVFRALAAYATAGSILHDTLTARRWYLVPIQDMLSFVFWIAGFFGNTIAWRGRTYNLLPDGRFQLIR